MAILKDSKTSLEESTEDMQKFFAEPGRIHYVGLMGPPMPGVSDCFQTLEFKYFTPGTPRNDLYIMRLIEWKDFLWGVVSIPIEEKHLMERAAQVNCLRIESGAPAILDRDGGHRFPVTSEGMFTLVTIPKPPVDQRSFH